MVKMTSKNVRMLMLPLMAGLLVAFGPAAESRAQDGVAEKAGEVLDSAGRGIRRGFENAFARTQDAVHSQAVIARVYSRIHWDRMLVGSALQLDVSNDGTVVLRRAVPDEAAKQRAVILARDTMGVTRVVDQLTVVPKVQTVPAEPPVAPGTTSTTVTVP